MNVTVSDTCTITCKKTGLKVLLHYMEEGWLGRTQNRVQGVVYKCDVEKDRAARIKDVSDKDIIGRIDGAWTDKMWFSKGSAAVDKTPVSLGLGPILGDADKSQESDRLLLVDVNPLQPIQKIVPGIEQQLPNESRRLWSEVTDAILARQFTRATDTKQNLEERQRQKAAERKALNIDWKPRFFTSATETPGRPELTAEGKTAMDRLQQNDWRLEPSRETGA